MTAVNIMNTHIMNNTGQINVINISEHYYRNCYGIIFQVSKQIKLIVQLINADMDGSTSDLQERLLSGYENIKKTVEIAKQSMPIVVTGYYNRINKNQQYLFPYDHMKRLIEKTDPNLLANNTITMSKLLTDTLDIGFTAVETCLDVTTAYRINNKIYTYEQSLASIFIFLIDIAVADNINKLERDDVIISNFYDNYKNWENINNSVLQLSYQYKISQNIYNAHCITMCLMNKMTNIYVSPTVLNNSEEKSGFIKKIKQMRNTDIVLDTINILDALLNFINE